jgi:hypothetical protein
MRQSLENATHTISAETLENMKLIEAAAARGWASHGMLRTSSTTDTANVSLIDDVRVKGVSLTPEGQANPKRGSRARK